MLILEYLEGVFFVIAPLLRMLEGSIDTCLHHIGSESFNGSSGLKTSHTRVGSCVETRGIRANGLGRRLPVLESAS